jgi:hypothetical protein
MPLINAVGRFYFVGGVIFVLIRDGTPKTARHCEEALRRSNPITTCGRL